MANASYHRRHDEIIYKARISGWVYFPALLYLVILAAAARIAYAYGQNALMDIALVIGAFLILSLLWKFIKNTALNLYFTRTRLHLKKGVFSTSTEDSPLDKIINVRYSNGLWGKIFNYGSLRIKTMTDTYYFDNIAAPQLFHDQLMDQIDSFAD